LSAASAVDRRCARNSEQASNRPLSLIPNYLRHLRNLRTNPLRQEFATNRALFLAIEFDIVYISLFIPSDSLARRCSKQPPQLHCQDDAIVAVPPNLGP
jgi:hypothetical protein